MPFDKRSYDHEYRRSHFKQVNLSFNKDNAYILNIIKEQSTRTGRSVNQIIIDALRLYLDNIDSPTSDKLYKL